jgi:fructuronate reductase
VEPVLLSRSTGRGRAAATIRLLHLGLGSFFRAHPAFFTDRSPDGPAWGYAAFTGRDSAELAGQLNRQDGLYTLVTRAPEGDAYDVVSSLSSAHPAADHDAWLAAVADPALAVVTLTVTEAGYLRRADGGLDLDRPEVVADLDRLRRDLGAPVRTAPARLVAGLAARRRADAGPLALAPCDNVPGNGAMLQRVVGDLADEVDPSLADWVEATVSVVSSVVDRITPRTVGADLAAEIERVRAATGVQDHLPVVTEPFREWVLAGAFPAGRPRWEDAGARFTEDVTPYEHRKLWLLNGAHSLLAYAGSVRGHLTVSDAIGDEVLRAWVEEWWAVACRHLDQPAEELAAYRQDLLERFANPRIRHQLAQVAADGSQKLPIRVLPTLHAERAAGRVPEAATRLLAAWVLHLRGVGAPVTDVQADRYVELAAGPLTQAVRRVLAAFDPETGADADVVATVVEQAREMTPTD